jgi:hypothetical protein
MSDGIFFMLIKLKLITFSVPLNTVWVVPRDLIRISGRMLSCGTLRRVVLVRTDVSEERSAYIFRVTITGEPRTTLTVSSNQRTLRRNIILHSHRRENLKFYQEYPGTKISYTIHLYISCNYRWGRVRM